MLNFNSFYTGEIGNGVALYNLYTRTLQNCPSKKRETVKLTGDRSCTMSFIVALNSVFLFHI